MNKRDFLKGIVATAAGLMVPAHLLAESKFEFHQRVAGRKLLQSYGDSGARFWQSRWPPL
jgi:hypothetical protein